MSVERNPGLGLPSTTFAVSSVARNIFAGTDDTIYYAEPGPDQAYDTWFRASYSSIDNSTALFFGGECRVAFSDKGTAFAAIGNVLLRSSDGKSWNQVWAFQEGSTVTSIAVFAEMLFVGTSAGVFSDGGSARSNSPSFRMEMVEATQLASMVYVNDMFATQDTLYVATDSPIIYILQSEVWTKTTVVGAQAIQRLWVTPGGTRVAVANNVVYTE
jgi:hypothetical protein